MADFDAAGETLLSLVDPQQPAEVQSRAIRASGRHAGRRRSPRRCSRAERFAEYTPAVREEVLSAMFSRQESPARVAAALE